MKRNILILSALILSSYAFATERTYVGKQTYWSADGVGSWVENTGIVDNTYSWAENDDFIFDGVAQPTAAKGVAVKYFAGEIFKANSMTMKTPSFLNFIASDDKTLDQSLRSSFEVKYFNVFANETASAYQIRTAGNVKVTDTLNIGSNNASTPASMTETIFSTSFADATYYYNSKTDHNLSMDVANLQMSGVIPTSANFQNTAIWYINDKTTNTNSGYGTTNAVVRIGNISGFGVIRNNFADYETGFTKLILAPTKDSTFVGMIKDDWSATAGLKLAKMQIIVDGNDGCTQTIRNSFKEKSVWGVESADFTDYGTIIKNGRLAVYSLATLSKIKLEGGAFLAATAGELADDANRNSGSVKVASIDWEGGMLGMTINRTEIITNTINQLGDEDAKYTFEIDVSDFDTEYTFESETHRIISTTTSGAGNYGDLSKYTAIFLHNGVEQDFTIEDVILHDDGLYIQFSGAITVIPEPSTIAAMLGIFALTLAIIRKRK